MSTTRCWGHLRLKPTGLGGWRIGDPFSGSRLPTTLAGAPSFVRQRDYWCARPVASANGAGARTPNPPAGGYVSGVPCRVPNPSRCRSATSSGLRGSRRTRATQPFLQGADCIGSPYDKGPIRNPGWWIGCPVVGSIRRCHRMQAPIDSLTNTSRRTCYGRRRA